MDTPLFDLSTFSDRKDFPMPEIQNIHNAMAELESEELNAIVRAVKARRAKSTTTQPEKE
jgi:hypothetical protein